MCSHQFFSGVVISRYVLSACDLHDPGCVLSCLHISTLVLPGFVSLALVRYAMIISSYVCHVHVSVWVMSGFVCWSRSLLLFIPVSSSVSFLVWCVVLWSRYTSGTGSLSESVSESVYLSCSDRSCLVWFIVVFGALL